MATDRNQPRGIRIDFQMPGERYYAQNVTPKSARASISAAIRESPLLSSVHELWVVPGANLLLGFRHLRTLVLGLHSVSLDTPWDVKCHWEPLRGLEVRDTDRVIPCPRLCTLCVYVTTEAHVVNLTVRPQGGDRAEFDR
ncbi:hypothetical protein GSI_04959 [Ganoderma sinense ZZ0214-1]|uniref:Uncharacterized protein n=1 Tax=Ganoderma sinense ZZ0214-1 TaxID=1077348 RepID=A0A2G8SGG1_9APHY|nr:hypothetical protein GSI_04959 [Ganoderma sinense ZZ0214-1]